MLGLLTNSWIVSSVIECWMGYVNVSRIMRMKGIPVSRQIEIKAYTKDPYLLKVRAVASQARNRVAKDTIPSMFGPLCPDAFKDSLLTDLQRLQNLFFQRVNDFIALYDPQKVAVELENELKKQNLVVPLNGYVPDKNAIRAKFRFSFSFTPLKLTDIIGLDSQSTREETEYLIAAILEKLRKQFAPVYKNIFNRARQKNFASLSQRDWQTLKHHLNRAAIFLAGLKVPTLQRIQQAIQRQDVLLTLLEMHALAEEGDNDVLYHEIIANL